MELKFTFSLSNLTSKILHVPNFTKPLGNVVLGRAWLWLLLFVGLPGPAVLWLAPLPAHPAALQLGGSILRTCNGANEQALFLCG